MTLPTLAPDAQSFVAKWLAHEPEMESAIGFLPLRHRVIGACWGALQNELFEAMIELRDGGVAQLKLAWWGDALARGAGQGAHPLLRALLSEPEAAAIAPRDWQALTRAAIALAAEDTSPGDIAAAVRVRREFATAVATVDAQLFSASPAPDSIDAIAAGLLLRQLRAVRRGQSGRLPWLPLQLAARHGRHADELDPQHPDATGVALIADFAAALDPLLAGGHATTPWRRCRIALDRRLVRNIVAGGRVADATPSRWSALWTTWRAARRISHGTG